MGWDALVWSSLKTTSCLTEEKQCKISISFIVLTGQNWNLRQKTDPPPVNPLASKLGSPVGNTPKKSRERWNLRKIRNYCVCKFKPLIRLGNLPYSSFLSENMLTLLKKIQYFPGGPLQFFIYKVWHSKKMIRST